MEVAASRYFCLSKSSKSLHGSLSYSLFLFLIGRLLMRQFLEVRWLRWSPEGLRDLEKAYDCG